MLDKYPFKVRVIMMKIEMKHHPGFTVFVEFRGTMVRI